MSSIIETKEHGLPGNGAQGPARSERGTESPPLVTFALFAYNQEKFVREAIEGAFSQTYENLEIILSDDCSTDRTFDVMQEMASAYKGSHQVRLRRSEVNFGTAQHVSAVARMARGNLIVVAAGDDISIPERCSHIVAKWGAEEYPVSTIHSELYSFTDSQNSPPVRQEIRFKNTELFDMSWYLKHKSLPFLSPTCAYSKELFTQFPDLVGGSFIEDGVMAFRTVMSGRFIAIPEALVKRRVSERTSGTGYVISEPIRWNSFLRSRIISYHNILLDAATCSHFTGRTAKKLERHFVESIIRLPRFIINSHKNQGVLARIRLFFMFLTIYPMSGGILHRAAFAVRFIEIEKNRAIQTVWSIGRALTRRGS